MIAEVPMLHSPSRRSEIRRHLRPHPSMSQRVALFLARPLLQGRPSQLRGRMLRRQPRATVPRP
jgi:hypothetical protein